MIKVVVILAAALNIFCNAKAQSIFKSFGSFSKNIPYSSSKSIDVFNPRYQILIHEPFIYGQSADGQIGYGLRGISYSGGLFSVWSYIDQNAIGVLLLITGTTPGGGCLVRTQYEALGNIKVNQVLSVRAMVASVPDSDLVRIGLGDASSPSATITDGFWFEMDNTVNNSQTNWFAKVSKAGVVTSVDTGVSDHLKWHWFEIMYNDKEAKFFIDGRVVAKITNNIPVLQSELYGLTISAYTSDNSDMRLRLDELFYLVQEIDKTIN